jgi:hypothetical protein
MVRVTRLIELLRADLATVVAGRGTIRLGFVVDFPLLILSPHQLGAENFEVLEDAGLLRVVGRSPVIFDVEFQRIDLALEFCKGIVELGVRRRALGDTIHFNESPGGTRLSYRSQIWGRRFLPSTSEPW